MFNDLLQGVLQCCKRTVTIVLCNWSIYFNGDDWLPAKCIELQLTTWRSISSWEAYLVPSRNQWRHAILWKAISKYPITLSHVNTYCKNFLWPIYVISLRWDVQTYQAIVWSNWVSIYAMILTPLIHLANMIRLKVLLQWNSTSAYPSWTYSTCHPELASSTFIRHFISVCPVCYTS